MEQLTKSKSLVSKHRKRKIYTLTSSSEPKNAKIDDTSKVAEKKSTKSKRKTNKKKKANKVETADANIGLEDKKEPNVEVVEKTNNIGNQKLTLPTVKYEGMSLEAAGEKYPILKNKELIERFMKVPLNNNQKGRIRQAFKSQLQGASESVQPDIIHGKIKALLNNADNLTDSELRRIRILYNMLKTALEAKPEVKEDKNKKVKEKNKSEKKDKIEKDKAEKKDKIEKDTGEKKEEVLDKNKQKIKGPKRYVVFLGNLPLNITKEQIIQHFSEMNEQIKDIRIPKRPDGKKSAIAYVELSNEPSYEFALSKHHSMLGNKRINVLYTAQKNGKVSKSEAKSKSAKLIALQKSGKLIGSMPLKKKRSHRRKIFKQAQKELQKDT